MGSRARHLAECLTRGGRVHGKVEYLTRSDLPSSLSRIQGLVRLLYLIALRSPYDFVYIIDIGPYHFALLLAIRLLTRSSHVLVDEGGPDRRGRQKDRSKRRHLSGVRKREKGRSRHVGDTGADGYRPARTQFTYVGVHTESGYEHRQQVAPGDVAMEGGNQVYQMGGKAVVDHLPRLGISAHLGIPHGWQKNTEPLLDRILAEMVVRAHVQSTDDTSLENDIGEIQRAQ